MNIRCSSLPRVLACPASLQEPEVRIDSVGDEARVGSAVHECLAGAVSQSSFDTASSARNFKVPEQDVRPLVWRGVKIWNDIQDSLAVAVVEEQMHEVVVGSCVEDHVSLSGSPDIIAFTLADEEAGEHADMIVWDWKTGVQGPEYIDQVMGYALLASKKFDYDLATHGCKGAIAWVREGGWEIVDLTPAMFDDFGARLAAVQSEPDRYGPSEAACKYCPRRHECPAQTALARSAIADLTAVESQLTDMVPADLAALKPKADVLKRLLGLYDKSLKAAVVEAGSLSRGDGREMYMSTREKRKLVLETAWPVLAELLGVDPEYFPTLLEKLSDMGAIDVKLTKVLDAVGDGAAKGQKGKKKDDARAQMDAIGAIEVHKYDVLTTRKEM